MNLDRTIRLGLACLVVSACTTGGRTSEVRNTTEFDAGKTTQHGAGGSLSGAGGGGEGGHASGGSPSMPGSGAATTALDAARAGCSFGGSTGSPVTAAALVDMKTLCSLGASGFCKRNAAQLLEGFVCDVTLGGTRAPPGVVVKTHTVGCGLETIAWNGGYGGPSQTFSLSTGELVAATFSSDVNLGPCDAFRYVAGEPVPPCATAVESTCVPNTLADGGVGPLQGCRAPTEPGCSTCCYLDEASNQCVVRMDTGAGVYGATVTGSPCAANCTPCAACTNTDEQALRALPERPDCDCALDPGIDPCFGPTSCGCWCTQFTSLARKCAGIVF